MNGLLRILITGAKGQVGLELQRSFASVGEVVAFDREGLDLASADQIRDTVRHVAPAIILNAAAYTAVDKAESEPDKAMAINAHAPGILAEEALRCGALLVHYSTDYVFDGSKDGLWCEDDLPNPLNIYGSSKLAGERAIREVGGKYLILRTSWVYGPHGRNFLFTMLRLGRERDRVSVVDDQYGAPTTAIEIADATRAIVDGIGADRFGTQEAWAGLYHMTCAGSTSWCGFAREIFGQAHGLLGGKVPEVAAIPASAYPTPATRPVNSRLSNEKLKAVFGVELAPWKTALEAVIHQVESRKAAV